MHIKLGENKVLKIFKPSAGTEPCVCFTQNANNVVVILSSQIDLNKCSIVHPIRYPTTYIYHKHKNHTALMLIRILTNKQEVYIYICTFTLTFVHHRKEQIAIHILALFVAHISITSIYIYIHKVRNILEAHPNIHPRLSYSNSLWKVCVHTLGYIYTQDKKTLPHTLNMWRDDARPSAKQKEWHTNHPLHRTRMNMWVPDGPFQYIYISVLKYWTRDGLLLAKDLEWRAKWRTYIWIGGWWMISERLICFTESVSLCG